MVTDAPQVPGGAPADQQPGDEPRYVAPGQSFRSVTDKISSLVLTRPTHPVWLLAFAINLALLLLLLWFLIGFATLVLFALVRDLWGRRRGWIR